MANHLSQNHEASHLTQLYIAIALYLAIAILWLPIARARAH